VDRRQVRRSSEVVNNTGVQRDVDFTKGLGDFLAGENEIRTNLEVPILLLSGLLIPHLRGRKGAVIVNVSPGLGFVPAARMPATAPRRPDCTPSRWLPGSSSYRSGSRSSRWCPQPSTLN
jgi:NAD(P)-dependent dehydrogenase (short-subunit alcohol dehydrogenase family)